MAAQQDDADIPFVLNAVGLSENFRHRFRRWSSPGQQLDLALLWSSIIFRVARNLVP